MHTIAEVATIFNVSKQTVRNWIKENIIKDNEIVRVSPRTTRIKQEAIDRLQRNE